jgi:hypothetical protein
MKRFRPAPTFANVIACIALFVSLGGVGYAAAKLAPNSVGTAQVKTGAITPPKLSGAAKATLTGPAGPTGPTGPAGAKGDPGQKGEKGDPGTVDIGPWHYVGTAGEPAFGAEFSNVDPSIALRFRKEGDVVRIEGEVESSHSGGWLEYSNRVVFVLPPGFRPAITDFYAPIAGGSFAQSAYVDIFEGEVAILGENSGRASFDSLTFSTTG